jgi:hypothetical protein
MKTKLIIKEIEFTGKGLLVTKCSILDCENDKELRIAKLTPELITLFKSIEIGLDDYVKFMEMVKINQNLKKLITDFNLKL